MEKKEIAAFFDRCAPWWDDDMIRDEEIIAAILDNGGIQEGVHVLDVACGTGVLFPDYLKRGAASVTGIDISPEMVKIARSKFPEVEVVCGDVETVNFDRQFDAVMVYNAFPHFPEPERLIARLAALLMERKGLTPGQAPALSWAAYRETQYDRLADAMRAALDLPAIYRMMEGSGRN